MPTSAWPQKCRLLDEEPLIDEENPATECTTRKETNDIDVHKIICYDITYRHNNTVSNDLDIIQVNVACHYSMILLL